MLEIVKLGPPVIAVNEIELLEKKDNYVHADDYFKWQISTVNK